MAWSYYATPTELGFKPWAMDFAPDNYGNYAFPSHHPFICNPTPTGYNLNWTTEDWDPSLRFWTLHWDPGLGKWLQGQDTSLPSILATCEFANQYKKWWFDEQELIDRGWLTKADHLDWQTDFHFIRHEIHALFRLMEDDRDRYMAEINAQADGLASYFIALLWLDSERYPWTMELIRCGLAIGNIVYMRYKADFKRVRPSVIAPGLVPPFGPPRHPSFPSGHSFLGHFIALLLLEIPQIAWRYGEPTIQGNPPKTEKPLIQPALSDVMQTPQKYCFTGPLLWLGDRLAKNRERAGVHYRSDSLGSRWLAGAIWALLTKPPAAPTANDPDPIVTAATPPDAVYGSEVHNSDLINCPTFRRVLTMAKAEWL
jgi:membrane-associated phospholipid phosphatase